MLLGSLRLAAGLRIRRARRLRPSIAGAALAVLADHFHTTSFHEPGNGAGGHGLEGIQCDVAP